MAFRLLHLSPRVIDSVHVFMWPRRKYLKSWLISTEWLTTSSLYTSTCHLIVFVRRRPRVPKIAFPFGCVLFEFQIKADGSVHTLTLPHHLIIISKSRWFLWFPVTVKSKARFQNGGSNAKIKHQQYKIESNNTIRIFVAQLLRMRKVSDIVITLQPWTDQ